MDHCGSTRRKGNLSSAFEKRRQPIGKNIQVLPRKLEGNSNKYNFYQYVSPNPHKKEQRRSSEAHLQSKKTSRGSYLEKEFSIFVKIFEFYLVIQSL